MQPFIHLHVHTQFSVLDGQASVPALVDKAIADGMKGLAITDHGNMFGIKEFFNYVKKKNGKIKDEIKEAEKAIAKAREENDDETVAQNEALIAKLNEKIFKPIFGCEMYVALKSLHEHVDKKDTGRHLIVLAKNETGYHNLIKIVSQAWTEGFYSHPRTDKEALYNHREGLIVCSACLGGEIPRLIQAGEIEEAERQVKWFKDTFGDDYYIELQRHKTNKPGGNTDTYEVQERVNPELIRIARKYDIKIIATNDVHFVNEEDAEAHDRLICVSTNKFLTDEKRMRYTKQEWMKTQAEMNEVWADLPEALTNTLEILDKVTTYTIDHKPILPNFPLPEGFNDNDEYLRYLTYEGAKRRWGEPNEEQRERLDFELDTIKNMGFPGYFLIVQDFIRAGRERGVSIGPGRGSAAGSAVAYCLDITQIDPIKYDLLFERFLNPDRISLPDIDVDFDDDGRYEVLKYVTEKYGAEKVAHIVTYQSMATKMAIKDMGRVMDMTPQESNKLAKLVVDRLPEVDGKSPKINFKNLLKYDKAFQEAYNSPDRRTREVMKYAGQLEGTVRGTGVHACGVIIGRDDITDWVPVSAMSDGTETVITTQYEGSLIEETGMIKMDFLGLKTLSIIKEALANIKESKGIDLDIDSIPLDDKETFKLYCDGRTTSTFQFESPGMQKSLRELKPSKFEDLIAMNALYRPGPMDYIPSFIARKHGREPIQYDIPIMKQYLEETYGITVYQEQVMLLSRLLANFTRGESDMLRKAMGKKQIDKMAKLKVKFMEQGQANGHKGEVLEKIWADWEKFASYAFNKSHATCYSWVAYQTAYLKAHYPAEYMAGVLSRNLNAADKLTKIMDETRRMGIVVKGPDINESGHKFSVTKNGEIRFGLSGIKSVGDSAVNAIVSERRKNGPFKDLYDFVERVNLSACNRGAIESLALAGAFDSFGVAREMIVAPILDTSWADILVKYGQRIQTTDNSNNLFGDMMAEIQTDKPPYPEYEPWNRLKLLEAEKNLVTMYLSAHPLDPYYMELTFACNTTCDNFENAQEDGAVLTMGGLVTSVDQRTSKTGRPWLQVGIEDFNGTAHIRLFGKAYEANKNKFTVGDPIYMKMHFQRGQFNPDFMDMTIEEVCNLEHLKGSVANSLTVWLDKNFDNPDFFRKLKSFESTDATERRGDLYLLLLDYTRRQTLRIHSRKRFVIDKPLVDFLKEWGIQFRVETAG